MAEFRSSFGQEGEMLRQKIRQELQRGSPTRSTSVVDMGSFSQQSPMPQQSPYSPVRDHVSELNSLRYELTLSVEKYSTMALCKEAADTRIHEMQSEVDASFHRITQLETELNHSRYESEIMRKEYQIQLQRSQDETDNLRREMDMHTLQWQSNSVLTEQRMMELEKQLQSHSVAASALTAQNTDADQRLHDLEKSLSQKTVELSEMTKKHSALQTINDSIESSNAQLLIQVETNMASITSRDVRIKELASNYEHVSNQMMEMTTVNTTNQQQILDLETHAKNDQEQIRLLKQQLSELTTTSSMERTTMIRRHSDETTTLRDELLACQSSSAILRTTSENTITDLNILLQKSNDENQSLKKTVTELTALKSTLETSITELQNQTRKDAYDVEYLTRQINELTTVHTTTKAALEKTINTMENVNRKGNDEISLLKNRLFDMESHLRTSTDDNEKLHKSLHDLTITNNDLSKDRETLQGKVRQYQEDIVGLRQQADLAMTTEMAKIHAEKTIISLESQRHKEQQDIDRLKKQLVDMELSERKIMDEKHRHEQMLEESTGTKIALEKELDVLKSHVRRDGETITTLKKHEVEMELLKRKDEDSIERLNAQIHELGVARTTVEKQVIGLEKDVDGLKTQVRRDGETITTLKRQGEDMETQRRKDESIIERLQAQVQELGAAKGEGKKKQEEIDHAKKTISELEIHIKRINDEVEDTKKQLLEANLKMRMGREENDRLLKHNNHLEKLQTESAVTMKKDRDEIDKLRISLLEIESQSRRDGDELIRVTHALTDITTTKNAISKQVNDMEIQLKKSREESERLKKQFEDTMSSEKSAADIKLADVEASMRRREDECNRLTRTLQESESSHTKIKAELERRISDMTAKAKFEAEECLHTKKQLAEMMPAKAQLDWQKQKHHEEIDRLTKLMEATTVSKEQSEITIIELTTQNKSDRQEREKLQRQLMENELILRTKQSELTHLQQQSDGELTALTAAKVSSDAEVVKWKEQYQKAMENVVSLQRDGLEHESLTRKQNDEIERLQSMLQNAMAAKEASDASILEVTATAKTTLTEQQQQSRIRHESLEKKIDDMTNQIMKDKEALESSRRELLERDLLIRQEKNESHRVQSLLDEMLVAKGHVEMALEGMEEQCRKEKEENERWRRNVIEHESNLRKAQDSNERWQAQVTSTEKQLMDAQIAWKQANEDLLMSRQKNAELTAIAITEDEVKKSLRSQLDESKRTHGLDKDHITSLNLRISELETLVESETNKCGRLTAKLDESASVRIRIENTISDLETQCSQQQEQIVRLTKQLNDLHIASKQREAVLENTIKSTQAEVTTATDSIRTDVLMGNNKITALLAAKAVAEQCISDLEASTTGLTQENMLLKSHIQELKGEKNKMKKEIESLQDELVELKAERLALQTQLKESKDESASLSASNVSFKALADKQMEVWTAQGKKDASEITALKKCVNDLETVLEKSKDELTELTTAKAAVVKDILSLKKQLLDSSSTADQRIGFLEGQCKAHETDNGLLQKQLEDQKALTTVADKELVELKSQLMSLQTSSSKTIVDLQTQLETTRIELISMSNQHHDLMTRSADAKIDTGQQIETLKLASTHDQTELIRVKALLDALQDEHDVMTSSATLALEKQKAEYESIIIDLQQNLDRQTETAAIELAALEARLYEECDAWEQEYSALETRFEEEQSLLQAASFRITSMAETMQGRSSKRASFTSTGMFDTSSRSTSFLVATVPPISPPPPPVLQEASVSNRRISVNSSFSLPPSPVGRLMSSRNPTGSRNSSMIMQMSSERDSTKDTRNSATTIERATTPNIVMDGIASAKAAVTGIMMAEKSTSNSSPSTLVGKLFPVGGSRNASMVMSPNSNKDVGTLSAEGIAQAFLSEKTFEPKSEGQGLNPTAQGPGLGEIGITSSTVTIPVTGIVPAVNESLLAVQSTMESLESTLLDKFSHLEAVLSAADVLERENEEAHAMIQQLEATIAAMEAQKVMSQEHDHLQQAKEQSQEEHDRQRQDYESLRASHQTLQDEHDALTHRYTTLTQKYIEAQEQQRMMTDTHDTLTRQMSMLESQLHAQEVQLMANAKELEESTIALEKVTKEKDDAIIAQLAAEQTGKNTVSLMRTDSERLRRVVGELTTAKATLQLRIQELETTLHEIHTNHHEQINQHLDTHQNALQTQADIDAASIEQAHVLLAEADTKIADLEQQLTVSQNALTTKSTESSTLIFQIMGLQSTIEDLNENLMAATLRADRERELAQREVERAKQVTTDLQISQRSVEDLERMKRQWEHETRLDQDTIAHLQHQVDQWHAHQQGEEQTDSKRWNDLHEINAHLANFAADRSFHDDLQQPNVKIALDFWGGEHVGHYTQDQLDAVRDDLAVGRVYERLKKFEAVCDNAIIKFPIDHLPLRLTELSEEAVKYNFGPDFCSKHHLFQTLRKRGLSMGRIKQWRGTPTGSPQGTPLKGTPKSTPASSPSK